MVRLESLGASGTTTAEALARLDRTIADRALDPDLVCAFYDCAHDGEQIHAFLTARFGKAAVLGGTSCNGTMTERGLGGPGSIGLLLLADPQGSYGTAAIELGSDPAACAEQALHRALEAADCAGELPELIWIYQAPGQEEAVIEGLRRVVGERCPIIGGSAADNTVAGDWHQLGPDGVLRNGLVVGVMFSSGGIGFAFQGGYEPAGPSGIVTRVGCDGELDSGIVTRARGRQILEIDGRPAAAVYNEWIGGMLSDQLDAGGSILAQTTMYPLGTDAGQIDGLVHYLLVHPDAITADGGLSTFATIEEGTRLFSMRGDRDRLVERAGKVVTAATEHLTAEGGGVAGALVVYCGGCMLAVGEHMPRVVETIASALGSAPFLGCFTFGEQGFVLDRNAHGNLMISAIVFGS